MQFTKLGSFEVVHHTSGDVSADLLGACTAIADEGKPPLDEELHFLTAKDGEKIVGFMAFHYGFAVRLHST